MGQCGVWWDGAGEWYIGGVGAVAVSEWAGGEAQGLWMEWRGQIGVREDPGYMGRWGQAMQLGRLILL